ncbi:MAG TPA: DnaD domain-containing protein [Bacillota bacterium]|nr:DnaD domain-containing protein [Bacillota bacterium]
MEQLFFQLLKNSTLSLPIYLLRNYKQIGITDEEMMLIIHIMDFKQDGKDFPTIHELKERMSVDEQKVIVLLQRLVKNNLLAIEDIKDQQTGIRSEEIQFDPLFKRIAQFLVHQQSIQNEEQDTKLAKEKKENLFTIFEKEFGRPLSPIECETLTMWQDNDHYSDELIVAALREAVISGKLYFRYIDRILFEWQRNNIRTPKQARDFSLKFRKPTQVQAQRKVEPFPFYNWLENES